MSDIFSGIFSLSVFKLCAQSGYFWITPRIYIKSILKIKSFNSVHSCSAESASNCICRSGFRRGANSMNSSHCLLGREYMFFANIYVSQVNCIAEVVSFIQTWYKKQSVKFTTNNRRTGLFPYFMSLCNPV
jgi:hypothetical protein